MDSNDNRSPLAINPWPMGDHDATPKKSRRGWFSGTPHKVAPQALDDSQDLPLLKLTHFTKKVMVCFDVMRTGTARTRELLVENPCDFPQELRLEKFPVDKGFSVPERCWELDGGELMRLPITWTPTKEGNAREMITFKCEGAFRLQVILLGEAKDPPKKKGPGRRSTFSVHRKAPLKVTQPKAALKPSRPTMILKPKGSQNKSNPLGRKPRPSTGKASKENQESWIPVDTSKGRKSVGGRGPAGVDDVNEPHIVLSTPSPMSTCERSPGEEFTALNSSLVEIYGDGMPMTAEDRLLENLKRQTLSVCNGMSPLLKTTKPSVFPKPALPEEECVEDKNIVTASTEMNNEEDPPGSPKRLSIEAKTTITKNKAPDTEQPPVAAHVRKNLFSSSETEGKAFSGNIYSPQDFEDSLNEPRISAFPPEEDEDDGPSSDYVPSESCVDAPKETDPLEENCCQQVLDTDNSCTSNCSNLPANIDCQSGASPAVAEPSFDAMIIPNLPTCDKNAPLDADAFKVHTSVAASRLTRRKRLSDPKEDSTSPPKKLRTEDAKDQGPQRQQPRDRTMNRTLALRKEAALRKSGRAAAKTKAQGRPTGLYKAKGPMKGVPMAKLNLLKQNKSAIPRHPMPFAAKNMFYDERWMEKQERGFARWLNYVLTPDDCPNDPSCKATKIDAGTLCVESSSKTSVALAPSKEDLSLRAYTARRKLNRLRRGACMLFQSEPIVRVIQKLEAEIEKRRIVVRLDRKLHADYGIKQRLLDLFLSYNPLWLRIGLETTYGEILPIQSNTDVVGLSRFVITRLLGNPDIADQYAHPTVPHLYGPGYEEALSQFTLKKFLVLVFFLDRAKLTRLIDHDPCLFCKDSEFKSSRDVLLHFSREYLRGEGDLTRHLSFMGYSVTHRQTALDEFDFSVTKLAADLRCGVRLARVVELLIHDWTLSSQLRVPAISRLQKIHNVEITLKAMRLDGGGVDARVIVDGHREKTLELLWRIIFQFQIGLLLNEQQITDEIAFLRKNLRLQKHLNALSSLSLTGDILKTDGRRDSNEPDVYFKSGRLSLLLKWCQVVCSFYGLKVENFTVAFSDGRALCYLVHHYHPSLLPLSLIHQATTQTQYQTQGDASDSANDDSFDGTWSNVYSPSTGKPSERDQLLANERDNFRVLYDKVSELGGVPGVVKSAEMSNTIPDEKVVITYVSYLCARLLDLHTETRAARTIQMVWKAYRLRQLHKHRQAQEVAAQTIQHAVRGFLTRCHHQRLLASIIKLQAMRRRVLAGRRVQTLRQARLDQRRHQAATSIQACVKGFLARRHYQKALKAILIQSAVRGYIARKTYLKTRRAVTTLQAAVRCYRERRCFIRMREAVVVLQRQFRANRLGRKQRAVYNLQRTACISIQATFRGYACRQRYQEKRTSAVVIQALIRAHQLRKRFLEMKSAAFTIQRYWRSALHSKSIREEYLELREAAVTVQSIYRGVNARRHAAYIRNVVKVQAVMRCCIQRKKYLLQKRACIVIQAFFRGYTARESYKLVLTAALVLQQRFRALRDGRLQLREYNIKRGAAITLQAGIRGVLARKRLAALAQSAVSIQAVWKMHRARKHYLALRAAAQCLQKHTRARLIGKATRYDYMKLKASTVQIQSHYRAVKARREFLHLKASCIAVQSVVRMYIARRQYRAIRRATITFQRRFRAKLSRDHQVEVYNAQRHATIILQAWFKGVSVRRQIAKQHAAALQIQAAYKTYNQRQSYKLMRSATLCLQKYIRAYLIGRSTRCVYLRQRAAAVVFQASYRALQARRSFLNQKQAAIKIQSIVRMQQAQSHYAKQRQAVIIIQTRYRALTLAQATFLEYQIKRGACITLQAGVRGFLVRQQMCKLHQAAVQIQTSYRSFSARTNYQKLKNAALVLQAHWRATRLTREVQQDFVSLKEAALVLQSAFRGKLGRRIAQEHFSARIIQSYVRMHHVCQQYQKQKRAVIRIQSALRMHQAHSRYTELRQAAVIIQTRYRAQKTAQAVCLQYQIYRGACITLQAAVRGFLVRQQIIILHQAAVQIQKSFRCFSACTSYHKLRNAAVVLQTHWRATRLSREVQQDYVSLKNASLVLQSAFRGKLGRRIALEHHSARIIQSCYRMHVTRQQFQMKRQAAVKIQAAVRMHQAHIRFTELRQAAVIIQTRYRAQKTAQAARLQYQVYRGACITLQAAVRGFLVRQQMIKLHQAAVQIQKSFRCFSARTNYHKLRNAAVVLQTHWRATRISREVHQDYVSLKKASLVLQSAFRGKLGRRIALEHHSARVIQSCYRMHVTRQQFQMKRQAAVKIQAAVRMHQAHIRFTELRQAAVIIQTRYRAQKTARAACLQYQVYRGACITLQAAVRGFLVRQQMIKLHQAAVQIQKSFRCFSARTNYHKLRNAAVVLQTHWRATRLSREVHQDYVSLKKASLVLQSAFRGKLGRRIALEHHSVRVIQSCYRMHVTRQQFQMKRQAAVKIQAAVRMHQAHIRFTELRQAAVIFQTRYRAQKTAQAARLQYQVYRGACITLQAAMRGFLVRQQMIKLHQAAVQIQKYFRCFSAHTNYLKLRNAAVVLQTHWRATRLSREVHRDYISLKKASVVLQSAFRGKLGRRIALEHHSARIIQSCYRMHVTRQQFQMKRQAAVKIQAAVRMHQAHISFTEMRQAAVIIQTRYRAQKTAQAARLQYQVYRGACITLQAAVRGFLVRQQMIKLHQAAVQIQKSFRCFSARTNYHKLRNAAVVLQTHWRATRLSREVHQNYVSLKKASLVLQSAFRGKLGRRIALEHHSARVIQSCYRMHVTRQQFQMKRQAAVKIQAAARMHQAHSRYTELRQAAVIIQTRYRAQKTAQAVCLQYQVYRGACITLQAAMRGFLVRQQVIKLHQAAVQIQKSFRCFSARTNYHKLRNAAMVLQTHWRATRLSREVQQEFDLLKRAVVVLQSAYRGQLGRHIALEHRSARLIQSFYRMHVMSRLYQTQKQAAIQIQAAVRMHQACAKYTELRQSVMIIQTRYRATKLAETTSIQYQVQRGACITVQAYMRGYLVRQRIHKLHTAATSIQKNYRAHHTQTQYLKLKKASGVLQKYWRATQMARKQQHEYVSLKEAAITIQSLYRGCVGRKVAKEHRSARLIQSIYRMHVASQKYTKLRAAASTVQSLYRMRKARRHYLKLVSSTVAIQKMFLGYLATKASRNNFLNLRHSVVTIQAAYRGCVQRRSYITLKEAATKIQALYRRKRQYEAYQSLKRAAIVLQGIYRASILRNQAVRAYNIQRGAAITIQAAYKAYAVRQRYIQILQAVTTIQASYRGHRQRARFAATKRAASVLQARFRAHLLMREALRDFQTVRKAAVIIQAAYRGHTARQSFKNIRSAATVIQAFYRGTRQRATYQAIRAAAIVLQKRYRAHLLQREATRTYHIQRGAAITIQAFHRGRLSRQLVKRIRAAIKLQAYARMLIQRCKYQALRSAANKIGATFRARRVRRDFLTLKQATEVIQARYRAVMIARDQERRYLTIREAAITIQSFFRGHQARKLVKRIQAAVKIQSACRGYAQQKRYQTVRKSTLLLQAQIRGMIARREFAVTRRNWQAAVCIQRHFRDYVVRRALEAQRQARLSQLVRFASVVRFHLSSIRIQRCYRLYKMCQAAKAKMQSIIIIQRWMRAKLRRLHYLKLRRGMVALQRCVRQHQAHRHQASVRIQAQARVWLARQHVKNMKAAALTIQSIWRGRQLRRSCKDRKVAAMRARCIKANRAATEENKLCNRTTSALDYLLQYKHMSGLLDALISLDVVSRLSATCCLRLVEGKAVPVIFILIRSCNRSLPCMEVIKYSVNILLNLAKYSPTAHAVFEEPESVNVILDLMQMYREKGPQIFAKVCMLMGTLCQDPRRAQVILSVPKNKDRLLGINRLTERKYSMDAKRALVRSRGLNSSVLSSSFLNASGAPAAATPRKQRRVQPDWVLGRGKMRERTDPLAACHFVLEVLKLK